MHSRAWWNQYYADKAYTQAVAAELALRWLMARLRGARP